MPLHCMHTTLTLCLAGVEREFDCAVAGLYIPPSKGMRDDPCGPQIEPDAPEEFEVHAAHMKIGDGWRAIPDEILEAIGVKDVEAAAIEDYHTLNRLMGRAA